MLNFGMTGPDLVRDSYPTRHRVLTDRRTLEIRDTPVTITVIDMTQ